MSQDYYGDTITDEMVWRRRNYVDAWFELKACCQHPQHAEEQRGGFSHCRYCEVTLRTEDMAEERKTRSSNSVTLREEA